MRCRICCKEVACCRETSQYLGALTDFKGDVIHLSHHELLPWKRLKRFVLIVVGYPSALLYTWIRGKGRESSINLTKWWHTGRFQALQAHRRKGPDFKACGAETSDYIRWRTGRFFLWIAVAGPKVKAYTAAGAQAEIKFFFFKLLWGIPPHCYLCKTRKSRESRISIVVKSHHVGSRRCHFVIYRIAWIMGKFACCADMACGAETPQYVGAPADFLKHYRRKGRGYTPCTASAIAMNETLQAQKAQVPIPMLYTYHSDSDCHESGAGAETKCCRVTKGRESRTSMDAKQQAKFQADGPPFWSIAIILRGRICSNKMACGAETSEYIRWRTGRFFCESQSQAQRSRLTQRQAHRPR